MGFVVLKKTRVSLKEPSELSAHLVPPAAEGAEPQRPNDKILIQEFQREKLPIYLIGYYALGMSQL